MRILPCILLAVAAACGPKQSDTMAFATGDATTGEEPDTTAAAPTSTTTSLSPTTADAPDGSTSTSTTGAADSTAAPGEDTTDPTGADAICGDGIVAGGEVCDDGNRIDDDDCPNSCGVCSPADPLMIGSAAIVGDDLVVEVTYAGGCEEHLVGLCWDINIAESNPVQTGIQLSHDAQGDMCDALITEVHTVDLSSMREWFLTHYEEENGTMIIWLDGWPESLVYSF